MASSSDESEDDFVVLGIPVPEVLEGQPQKKPITVQDLTARDKQGRRRFHGAFTGGFSAGYFDTVGTKEGFTPSTFVSSRSKKNDTTGSRPEDFMDEEDLEEHGIAPRKFAATANFTSEERKRKHQEEAQQITAPSSVDFGSILSEIVIPQHLPIGIKLLHKMGWREGQGLGPRVKKKKKRRSNLHPLSSAPKVKVYGCAPPPSEGEETDSDDFVPEEMVSVTFALQDKTPIPLEAKDNVHGLGYRGLDPSLALPGSHIKLFDAAPVSLERGKFIKGKAFGVGAFEDEDEDIYAVDDMSNYDITMKLDEEEDNKFGWTAPRQHGKQAVPVSYVGKLLEGFALSSKPLKPKKKFAPPPLPRDFKPQHWFRKRRGADKEDGSSGQLTSVERSLMLGETPIMNSVFDLVPKEDRNRIEATKEAISMTQSLVGKKINQSSEALIQAKTPAEARTVLASETKDGTEANSMMTSFLSKFKLAEVATVVPSESGESKDVVAGGKTPLFQGKLNFQPFRKDPAKQERYDKYLTLVKQGITDPYNTVVSSHMTEWERSRERDEFARAAKIYRPMSAMMSTRFVTGAMIDDEKVEIPLSSEADVSDQAKAVEMKMFGKLTREEFEWHPEKLLCRRFNVPNPYPGSDIVGLPTVKRDKFSVFNFLDFGDYQPKEFEDPVKVKATQDSEPPVRTLKPNKPKRTMASVFKVLDDPDFHKPPENKKNTETPVTEAKEQKEEREKENEDQDSSVAPDVDLFRAIFKNSDSEDSDSDREEKVSDEEEGSVEDDKSKEEENDRSGRSNTAMEIEDITGVQQMSGPDNILTSNSGHNAISDKGIPFSSEPSSSQGKLFKPVSSTPAKVKKSRWGEKSVFSVIDDLDNDINSSTRQQIKVSLTDDTVSRLSGSDKIEEVEAEKYGPRLPSPSHLVSDGSQHLEKSAPSIFKEKTFQPEKQKDKHRNRHKHKKEKMKKSKHKKEKKHKKHKKSSKSSKAKKEEHSSGSEADTESDSEDSDLDSALLERLKQVSGSGKSLKTFKHL